MELSPGIAREAFHHATGVLTLGEDEVSVSLSTEHMSSCLRLLVLCTGLGRRFGAIG